MEEIKGHKILHTHCVLPWYTKFWWMFPSMEIVFSLMAAHLVLHLTLNFTNICVVWFPGNGISFKSSSATIFIYSKSSLAHHLRPCINWANIDNKIIPPWVDHFIQFFPPFHFQSMKTHSCIVRRPIPKRVFKKDNFHNLQFAALEFSTSQDILQLQAFALNLQLPKPHWNNNFAHKNYTCMNYSKPGFLQMRWSIIQEYYYSWITVQDFTWIFLIQILKGLQADY